MKTFNVWLSLCVVGCFAAPLAYAEDAGTGEETVIVVDANETPTDIVKQITLPDSASDTARERSAFGIGVANAALDPSIEQGQEFGQQVSQDARSRDISEQVRQDVERNARADARGDNAGDHGRP
jgi:hypothetical protein